MRGEIKFGISYARASTSCSNSSQRERFLLAHSKDKAMRKATNGNERMAQKKLETAIGPQRDSLRKLPSTRTKKPQHQAHQTKAIPQEY